MMTIEQLTMDPDVTVLQVQGRISMGRDAQELEWKVDDLLKAQAKHVVLDLTGVNYLDSTGIGIIVMCAGKLKDSGGKMSISGPVGTVAHTLELCRVTDIVPIFATLELAASSFAQA
jgi:anti-sigma B factor antagonist